MQVIVRDREEKAAEDLAAELAGVLMKEYGVSCQAGGGSGTVSVMGPYPPAVDKVSDLYIRHIRISMKKGPELAGMKKRLDATVQEFCRVRQCAGNIVLDVDP